MINNISDKLLMKAWEKEDSSERQAAREEVLAKFLHGIKYIEDTIVCIDENRRKICLAMMEKGVTKKQRRRFKREKESLELSKKQGQMMLIQVSDLYEWYRKLWGDNPLSDEERYECRSWLLNTMIEVGMIEEMGFIMGYLD